MRVQNVKDTVTDAQRVQSRGDPVADARGVQSLRGAVKVAVKDAPGCSHSEVQSPMTVRGAVTPARVVQNVRGPVTEARVQIVAKNRRHLVCVRARA